MSDPREQSGGFGLMPPGKRRDDVPAVAGLAGAAGRDATVQQLLQRSYDAGFGAPQEAFDGDIYRSVASRHADTFLEHKFSAGDGKRYNPLGLPILYASPSNEAAVAEAEAYERGMKDRTLTRSHFTASPNPETGRGGVANLFAGMYAEGLSPSAMAVPKGDRKSPWIYRMLGEHPYSMSEQAGQGASDAGASAIRAPSATSEAQIDVIPRNTLSSQITPIERTSYDADAAPGPTEKAVSARPMPHILEPTASVPTGMVNMPAGYSWRDAVSPEKATEIDSEIRSGKREKPPSMSERASSLRYGAIGGGATALGSDLYRRFGQGENVSGEQMALNAAKGTAVGGGSALALDAVTQSMGGGISGGIKAGGLVGGLLEGGLSAFNNSEAYRSGRQTASQAAANTLVDTGLGLGAGASGAALGAGLGSIMPVGGTALGAGLGFLGGTAGSYLAHKLADNTGFTDWAKHGLGNLLSGAERPLGLAWNGLSKATHPIAEGASSLYRGAAGAVTHAGHAISHNASDLYHWMAD